MVDAQALKDGTWIRSKVAVGDSGDFNEREAPAGALARIALVDAGADPSWSVVFWPTFITNFWNSSDIARDAEVLPEGHPDIPTPEEYDFASAVADIVAEGDVDDDERTVTAPADVVDRVLAGAGAGRNAGHPRFAELLGEGGGEVTLSFDEFDELAALAGVGDRLSGEDAPRP